MKRAMAGLGLLLAAVLARNPDALAMSMTVDGAQVILSGKVRMRAHVGEVLARCPSRRKRRLWRALWPL